MKFSQLGIIMFGTAVVLSPVILSAQSNPMNPSGSTSTANQPGQQPSSTTAMQDSGTNAGEVSQTMNDKIFLRKAAEGGMAEVQFGQLAAQKASSDDVKAFGQKMVDDHTALNNEMATVADSLGVRAPKTIDKKDQTERNQRPEVAAKATKQIPELRLAAALLSPGGGEKANHKYGLQQHHGELRRPWAQLRANQEQVVRRTQQ